MEPSTNGKHSASEIWQQTLDQLQFQMPQATFDALVKELRLIESANNHYTIAAASNYAQEWVQNRLHATIQRTLAQITGRPDIELIIVVDTSCSTLPPPERNGDEAFYGEIPLDLLAFDTFDAGFFPKSNYIQQFWGTYLGALNMQLIDYVRSFYHVQRYIYDKKAKQQVPNPNWQPWTPPREFHAMELARALSCDYHQIIGRWRTCHKYNAEAALEGKGRDMCWCGLHAGELAIGKPTEQYPEGKPICHWWRPGVFDRLQAEGIITVEKQGELDKIATVYFRIQVYQPLPLLTPWQMSQLSETVQREHHRFLVNRINLEWWKAIKAERLMPYLNTCPNSLISNN